MKKFNLFLILFVLVTINGSAQSRDGKVMLGGRVQYASGSIYYDNSASSYLQNRKVSELNVEPRLGYFLSENWQLGFGINYFRSKTSSEGIEVYNSGSYLESVVSINTSLRNYQNIFEGFGFFSELGVGIGFGSGEEEVWDYYSYPSSAYKIELEYDISEFSISVNPGFFYNISDHLGLEISVGGLYFSSTTSTLTKPKSITEPEIREENFGVQFTFESLRFGIQYTF